MEPKLPTPEFKQEQYVVPASGPEVSGQQIESRPELRVESSHEASQVGMPSGLPPVVIPPLVQVTNPVQTAAPAVDDNPLTAGDDDLIEREWVDKAKKIIATTKDDPHQREVQIAKLQVDYLRKRYGKELGEVA